jgi:hypothetical protein
MALHFSAVELADRRERAIVLLQARGLAMTTPARPCWSASAAPSRCRADRSTSW